MSTPVRTMNAASASSRPPNSLPSLFCCNQCGNIEFCRHKRTTAQYIRFTPTDEVTANELRTSQKHIREEVWADMVAHSCSTTYAINPEEPQFIQDSLANLNNELSKINRNDKVAYEQALQQSLEIQQHQQSNPNEVYVTSDSFKLSFLRADRFNAKDAAKKIVGYFQIKMELFGVENLCKELTFDDLSYEEQCILRDGEVYRFLPETDHAGRHILFSRGAKADFEHPERNFRVLWVLINTMAKDNEQFQKLGCVNILYLLDGYPENGNFDFFRQASKFLMCSPIRLVAIYSLVDFSSAWTPVLELANYCMGKIVRLRARSIHGSPQECRYSLMCLGFTAKNIPKELSEDFDECLVGEGNKKRKRQQPQRPELIEDDV